MSILFAVVSCRLLSTLRQQAKTAFSFYAFLVGCEVLLGFAAAESVPPRSWVDIRPFLALSNMQVVFVSYDSDLLHLLEVPVALSACLGYLKPQKYRAFSNLTCTACHGASLRSDPTHFRFGWGTKQNQVLRVTILEAEAIRNVAVLKKTDSYVAAELVTTAGTRESRTSVMKVRRALSIKVPATPTAWSGSVCRPVLVRVLVLVLILVLESWGR